MLKINEHVFLCLSNLSSTLQIKSQGCGGGLLILFIYLFIYILLAASGLSCGMGDLSSWLLSS